MLQCKSFKFNFKSYLFIVEQDDAIKYTIFNRNEKQYLLFSPRANLILLFFLFASRLVTLPILDWKRVCVTKREKEKKKRKKERKKKKIN